MINNNNQDDFIEELIDLYEKIGTFNGVKNYIKRKYNISISDITIKKKIKKRFDFESRNFERWVEKNIKSDPKYADEDLNHWKLLHEKIGSFLGVPKYIENQYGRKIHDTTIKRGLERKFRLEGRNFEKWVLENDKSIERSGFEEIYTEQDVKYWIKLYQEIG